MRIRTRAALAAVPLALTLALTGCGSGGGNSEVASANDAGKDGGNSASPSLSRDEMMRKLAQCLRDQGLEVEDPKPGEGLKLNMNGMDKDKAAKAQAACRKYNPQGEDGEKGPGKEEQEKMLKLAQCMRKEGVEEFPDPKSGGGMEVSAEVADDPDFPAAQKKCNEALGLEVPNDIGREQG